ncbi:MAG: VPLPA-CTERM sorting domain-containing protein [Gammaproteobacteria bacterium]|nr:VPLPA-CTERM sorting domain-containing protein [Gammaproteobacteria bacterium]
MLLITPASTTISLTAVPLPAAAWLFGSALLGLGWAKRSRRQQQEVLCA